jgi:hypothetical protein
VTEPVRDNFKRDAGLSAEMSAKKSSGAVSSAINVTADLASGLVYLDFFHVDVSMGTSIRLQHGKGRGLDSARQVTAVEYQTVYLFDRSAKVDRLRRASRDEHLALAAVPATNPVNAEAPSAEDECHRVPNVKRPRA